jgi:uncharacterized Zn-binding protein involved in type VI secretion
VSKQVCRVGDKNDAGGVILDGDSTVLVNNQPIAVDGSRVSSHADHPSTTTISTNNTVLINGKPVVILDDKDACGHVRIEGSPDVITG